MAMITFSFFPNFKLVLGGFFVLLIKYNLKQVILELKVIHSKAGAAEGNPFNTMHNYIVGFAAEILVIKPIWMAFKEDWAGS